MSTYLTRHLRAPLQGGFTLVELMVSMAIAVFLLGGLVTIVQNVRIANMNQTRLAQLQDEERFALTVITDAVQAGGYFGDPTTQTNTVWGPQANIAPAAAFQTGWIFAGSHTAGVPDTIATRFQTAVAPGYGPILCDGTDTSLVGGGNLYWIQFSVVQDPTLGWQLLCSVNNGAPVPLVTGVQAMTIYYGVKRDFTLNDFNVDTYVTWDNMSVLNGANDYVNVSSVLIELTFANPLAGQPGQPPTIKIERVIEVMNRAGLHT